MADLHYLAINFKFESLCIKSKKKTRVVFTTGVLQWLVTVCCCACHLIKMSYLLVLVVPCYQFKLGWRICNINWSYYFVFRFLSPGVQSFDPFLCCLCCRRFRSDSLQKPSRWEKGKVAGRHIMMYVLLFEFHSRDSVSAFKTNDILQRAKFSALITWKAKELLVLILKCSHVKILARPRSVPNRWNG